MNLLRWHLKYYMNITRFDEVFAVLTLFLTALITACRESLPLNVKLLNLFNLKGNIGWHVTKYLLIILEGWPSN